MLSRRIHLIEERDNLVWRRLNSVARNVLARGLPGKYARNLVVNEYPKSGGTWLAQMLAAATGLPFPTHRLPMMRPQILQGHYLWPAGIRDAVVIWRDGRDVMLSFYFQRVIGNEYSVLAETTRIRQQLGISDPSDIEGNLPRFLEYCFTTPRHPRFNWGQFVSVWAGRRSVVETKYESLKQDAGTELARVLSKLDYPMPEASAINDIVEQFSFRRQSQKRAQLSGHQRSNGFLRKGIVGDWKNHFSIEARQLFDHYAGTSLIALGYETNHEWATLEPCKAAV